MNHYDYRFINVKDNKKYCLDCFIANKKNCAIVSGDKEILLKNLEELEKEYELKIRKQIADGEFQIL